MDVAIQPSLQFLSLPEDLQFEILNCMDYRSLLRCTLVSRPTIIQSIIDSHGQTPGLQITESCNQEVFCNAVYH